MTSSGRGRWIAGIVVATVLAAGGLAFAALRGPHGCTDVGGVSGIRFSVPTGSRPALGTIRVTLRQKGRSDFVEFSPEPTNKFRSYIERGVYVEGSSYTVGMTDDLNRGPLDADWDGDKDATLRVDGLGKDAHLVFRHEETFRFKKSYPNGKGCDPHPYLSHTTSIEQVDLVSTD